jgi:hypothetical protein
MQTAVPAENNHRAFYRKRFDWIIISEPEESEFIGISAWIKQHSFCTFGYPSIAASLLKTT